MTSDGTRSYEHGIRYHAPRQREPGPVVGVAASLLILLVAGQLALAPSEREEGLDGPVAVPAVTRAPTPSTTAPSARGDAGVATLAAAAVVELRFDSGVDTPSPGAADVLDGVADEVLGDPAATVRVIGHAEASNDRDLEKQVSLERALRVVDLLGRRGVPAERVQVVAAGATQAAGAEADDNRRVTVEVTSG